MAQHDISFLRAIQEIPGDTADKKFRWLGRTDLNRLDASGDIDQLTKLELLPISPFLRVETAVKKKIIEDIEWALKSEDCMIAYRALKATWFFDGSHKDRVNADYFRDRILPYVSMRMRTRLTKKLASELTGKEPVLAEQMFTMIESIYGVHQALPLITACNEDFAYKTIVKRRIVLSYRIAKTIFRKNPDFIVRYLRLNKGGLYEIKIKEYEPLLLMLVKRRLEAFAELYEMHEKELRNVKLSNTCASEFLRKGMKYLIKKPRLYIRILPLKMINASRMESIFLGLFPEKASDCDIDKMMEYLKYYPEEKKASLLCKTYEAKYGTELLNSTKNVTPELMQLLPAEDRIKHAKIKIKWEKLQGIERKDIMSYETCWICYLPIEESIPDIKKAISTASAEENRLGLIWQMIYICKINKDDNELLNTLLYFKNRHKNEEYWVHDKMMFQLLRLYDVAHLEENIWSVLSDIIRLCYIKHGCVTQEMLLAMAHYQLLHNMPITETIDMFLETQHKQSYIRLDNMLNDYPQYERECLVTCIDIIQEKYNFTSWKETKHTLLYSIIAAMYNFNDRCKKSRTTVNPMTIRDYPWLMNAVQRSVWSLVDQRYYYNELKNLFEKHEVELYNAWFATKAVPYIADVTSGKALNVLRREPERILDRWKTYLIACKDNYHFKNVQRFVRATRWYKDIPIKFTERCIQDIEEEEDEPSVLVILAILLHGESFTKLLDPLVPKETTVDISLSGAMSKYKFALTLPMIIKLSNPPVPPNLVARLCEGDYLSVALRLLNNLCRRTNLPIVISLAQDLAKKRVSVRKHGIRMMCLVASRREISDFFLSAWKIEDHYSIRGVLLHQALQLFYKEPDPVTWSLLSTAVSSLTVKDEMWFSELVESPIPMQSIPEEYISRYIQLLFDMINKPEIERKVKHLVSLFRKISGSVCNLLPCEFTANILRRYLFHENDDLSRAARNFTVDSYLLSTKRKFHKRLEVFKDTFVKEVTERWNTPHPKKSRFYPVNHSVHQLLEELVITFISNESNDTRIIQKVLDIFLLALTPQMDARSYLLLVYAKTWEKGLSPVTYGLRLGEMVAHLVWTFSSLLIPFMSESLRSFLLYNNTFEGWDVYEANLCVVEGLIEAGSTESCFMAATMLSLTTSTKYLTRYDKLVKKLQEMDHPGIKSVLYDYLNSKDYDATPFDDEPK